MKKEDLLVCETVLKNELNKFGYSMENQQLLSFSLPRVLGYRFHDIILRIPQRVKAIFHILLHD